MGVGVCDYQPRESIRNGVPLVVSRRRKSEESISKGGAAIRVKATGEVKFGGIAKLMVRQR